MRSLGDLGEFELIERIRRVAQRRPPQVVLGIGDDAAILRPRAGEDFAELAANFSDDPGTRAQGGVLGSFPDNELSPQFRGAIEGLEVGGISDPVGGTSGYFILKVLGRESGGAYEFDEVQEQLRRVVEEEAIQAELQRYLEGLRARFHIERRT